MAVVGSIGTVSRSPYELPRRVQDAFPRRSGERPAEFSVVFVEAFDRYARQWDRSATSGRHCAALVVEEAKETHASRPLRS